MDGLVERMAETKLSKKRRDYFNGNVKWQRVTDTVKDLNALPEL